MLENFVEKQTELHCFALLVPLGGGPLWNRARNLPGCRIDDLFPVAFVRELVVERLRRRRLLFGICRTALWRHVCLRRRRRLQRIRSFIYPRRSFLPPRQSALPKHRRKIADRGFELLHGLAVQVRRRQPDTGGKQTELQSQAQHRLPPDRPQALNNDPSVHGKCQKVLTEIPRKNPQRRNEPPLAWPQQGHAGVGHPVAD